MSNTDSALGRLSLQQALTQKTESLAANAAQRPAADRHKAAQEFASLLFLEVLKAMRAATPQEGLVENENLSRDIFTSMMDREVARMMAQRDPTGFTRTVEKALEKAEPQRHAAVQPQEAGHGIVSSPFGMRADPLNGAPRFHQGVDIAAPSGTPVRSAADGKVIFSGRVSGYGNLVEVDHGSGWVTLYGHNDKNVVAVGDAVKAGDTLALVGSTGRSTGSHVHFEVRREGKPVNPEEVLGKVVKGSRVSAVV